MRTRVKICGITCAEDAALAVEAGADALGVVLAPSPRRVALAEAVDALKDVPPLVSRVGVFVDPTLDEITSAIERLGLDLVQLSGDESPELCRDSPAPVLKAIHVGTPFDAKEAEPYRGLVAALLFDTHVTGIRGGTGKTFGWHTLHEAPDWAPLFLAGGLTPDNVGEAVRTVRPYAVDVSSGVEVSPGHKDHTKVRTFIAAVRAADSSFSGEIS
jgi:phosphoribosylanthranilate isomerase